TPPGATPSSTTSSTAPSVWEPCPRCPGSTGPRSSRWSSTRRSDSARRVPGRGCHGDARYDQVKYHTDRRDLPAYGVLPNEGAFLGLAVTDAEGTATSWLRDLAWAQRYETGFWSRTWSLAAATSSSGESGCAGTRV